MKRRTLAVAIRILPWGLGMILNSLALAAIESNCVNCLDPALTSEHRNQAQLSSQVPGLEVVESGGDLGAVLFGTNQGGLTGIFPAQGFSIFPDLAQVTASPFPGLGSSWLDRIQPGALPVDWTSTWRAPLSPDSFQWNWSTSTPFGTYNPRAAFAALWSTPGSPWSKTAAFLGGAGLAQ